MFSNKFNTTNELIVESVNINVYPVKDEKHSANARNQLTLGDLHGNALKLLFFLVRQNVLEMSSTDYGALVAIYLKETSELTKKDFEDFNKIIANSKVNHAGTVRLVGDELADRGANDYFTLKIIEKLSHAQVPLEILLSNHGMEFLEPYEKKTELKLTMLHAHFAYSMLNLQTCIEKNFVTRDEINSIMEKCYKPVLKALSYTLSEDNSRITIYSHAGIGLSTIQAIAKKLNVEFDADSSVNLAKSIDKINLAFSQYVQKNEIHTLYTRENMWTGYNNSPLDEAESPFEFLMWNRFYHKLNRPETHNGFAVDFVHGHDPSESSFRNIFNLDNTLGKSRFFHQGTYNILFSQDNSQLKLAPPKEEKAIELKAEEKENVVAEKLITNIPATEKKEEHSASTDSMKQIKEILDKLVIGAEKLALEKEAQEKIAAEKIAAEHARQKLAMEIQAAEKLAKEQVEKENRAKQSYHRKIMVCGAVTSVLGLFACKEVMDLFLSNDSPSMGGPGSSI